MSRPLSSQSMLRSLPLRPQVCSTLVDDRLGITMTDAPDPKVTTGWTVQNQGASGHELALVTSEGSGDGGGPDLAAVATGLVATEVSRAETAEGLKLAKASNLSDLASAATARTNLGLGTAATTAATAYDAAGVAAGLVATEAPRAETAEGLKLAKEGELLDLASAATACTNLGLGTAATTAATAYDAAGVAAGLVAGVPLHSATIQNVYGVTDVAGLIAALVTAGIVTNTA